MQDRFEDMSTNIVSRIDEMGMNLSSSSSSSFTLTFRILIILIDIYINISVVEEIFFPYLKKNNI